ncbi:MAG: sugar kinase [Spirochaetaceae bacterium]|jgi:xylulokinase|nr:sugar kinase [Spirochaetaceae bacterium]
MSYFLCVDIGTSSLKAAIIDSGGSECAFVREPYLVSGRPVLACDWERALEQAVKSIIGTQKESPAALCISGNGPTLVPVTAEGESLPPIHWYDKRARTAAVPSLFLPYADVFARTQAHDYAAARFLFSAQEWLAWRLGARAVTTLPSDFYRPYYWDEEQCRLLGLDHEKFPSFAAMGTVIGATKAGALPGLASSIPIVAGGPDFVMALIGTGVIKPGMVCDRAGTSEGINICTEEPVFLKGLRTLPHPRAGLWNLSGLIPESGKLFERYRKEIDQADCAYEQTLEDIFSKKTQAAVQGMAVLERIASQVRRVLDIFARGGFPITQMRVSGGQAKSALWNKLKSELIGCCLLVPRIADGELAGNAALCAAALGLYPDWQSAAEAMIKVDE